MKRLFLLVFIATVLVGGILRDREHFLAIRELKARVEALEAQVEPEPIPDPPKPVLGRVR